MKSHVVTSTGSCWLFFWTAWNGSHASNIALNRHIPWMIYLKVCFHCTYCCSLLKSNLSCITESIVVSRHGIWPIKNTIYTSIWIKESQQPIALSNNRINVCYNIAKRHQNRMYLWNKEKYFLGKWSMTTLDMIWLKLHWWISNWKLQYPLNTS